MIERVRQDLFVEIELLRGDLRATQKKCDELRAENERLRAGNERLGAWMSAALSDPSVCKEMQDDIRAWFDAVSI